MAKSANLGFPRIGAKRELKKALEAYWKAEIDAVAHGFQPRGSRSARAIGQNAGNR